MLMYGYVVSFFLTHHSSHSCEKVTLVLINEGQFMKHQFPYDHSENEFVSETFRRGNLKYTMSSETRALGIVEQKVEKLKCYFLHCLL